MRRPPSGCPSTRGSTPPARRSCTTSGSTEVVLLTNNPTKVTALRHLGVDVVAVERLHGPMGEDNEQYLITKRERLGHDIPVTNDRHGGKETA